MRILESITIIGTNLLKFSLPKFFLYSFVKILPLQNFAQYSIICITVITPAVCMSHTYCNCCVDSLPTEHARQSFISCDTEGKGFISAVGFIKLMENETVENVFL